MNDMPSVDELLGNTPDPPPPVRAIVAIISSPGDDSEGRLELRPWPDASPEERAIIAQIEHCQSAWVGPRELLKHRRSSDGDFRRLRGAAVVGTKPGG